MGNGIKKKIIDAIQKFVARYQATSNIETTWGVPIVGFAAADDPFFSELKHLVSPTHALPEQILECAQTVIAFFLPFPRSLTATNVKDRMSSRQWAVAYVETNELIRQLSLELQQVFDELGHQSCTIPATHNWDEEKLISNWSHRHIAYIAGLGQFGLNNMLITAEGCCGRVGSFITTMALEPDLRSGQPSCLYKFDGTCQKCVRKCVNKALFEDSFDRFKCYEMLLKNVDEHKNVGYADVCGKCLVAVPCSHIDPVAMKQCNISRKGVATNAE